MTPEPLGAALRQRLSPVRTKLTLLATVLLAVVLSGSAIVLVTAQKGLMLRGIDATLTQRADNVQARVARGDLGRRLPSGGDPEDSFLQVVGSAGRVVASTANAAGLPPASPALHAGPAQQVWSIRHVPLSSQDFRVLARRVGSGADAKTLVVATNLQDMIESVHVLESSLAISIPVVTALLGWLVWWLTGRALRPVESIRAEVASMGGSELNHRVPIPATHDEISRLARTMNAMLDRVEQAAVRQRQFVADASHELRGPLTRMRSSLEVALAHPDSTDPTELYEGLREDTVDLQRLVEDLLFLARSDSDAFDEGRAPVDLDDLVLAEAQRLRQGTAVRVDTSGVSVGRTLGDAGQLARAIRNLASNAVRHANCEVKFELREFDGECELVVADDGPGVPQEHRVTVFKRFTRLDEARSRDAGGAGLGLAIVHDIVARHGGTVCIADKEGHGARFVVRLPRAD